MTGGGRADSDTSHRFFAAERRKRTKFGTCIRRVIQYECAEEISILTIKAFFHYANTMFNHIQVVLIFIIPDRISFEASRFVLILS